MCWAALSGIAIQNTIMNAVFRKLLSVLEQPASEVLNSILLFLVELVAGFICFALLLFATYMVYLLAEAFTPKMPNLLGLPFFFRFLEHLMLAFSGMSFVSVMADAVARPTRIRRSVVLWAALVLAVLAFVLSIIYNLH
jgi:hypothetical protein